MARSANTHEMLPASLGHAMAGEVSACDPVSHEQMVRPWDLCHRPMERGEFGYHMRYLKIPGITLYREVFDLRCVLQGLSPVGTFAFAVPLGGAAPSAYWGSPLDASGMPAMLPGGLDVVLEHGHKQLVILIDLSLMHSHVPADVVEGLELAAIGHRLPASQEDVRYLGNCFSGLIDSANQTPAMLHYPSALRSIAEDVLRHLVSAVNLSLQPPSRSPYSTRKKGLDRALEYLRHADFANQSIPEISKAAGVSQRTLEYAFRDVFGLTPLGFLRLRRMHAARRDLLCEGPEHVTVMAIAYRHGFYHPARFANNYRQLFGEQPSATLKRSRRSDDQNLSPLLG